MRRRAFIAGLSSAAVWPANLAAQVRRPLIVYFGIASAQESAPMVRTFLQGLRELGYREGQDYDIVYRFADGDLARVPALAQDAVGLKPDVIYAINAAAAKLATSTIPIVSPVLNEPVRLGLVASEARPGGNVTGVMTSVEGLPGKHVELARELIPGLNSLGMLTNVSSSLSSRQQHDVESAVQTSGLQIVPADLRTSDQLEAAFQIFVRERVQIVDVLQDTLFFSYRRQIALLAISAKLPTIFFFRDHVEAGGLISYGVNLRENHRRAAAYIVKILSGAKPGDLPVEFPTKLELVINLKTAKAIGFTVPAIFLARADEVIE
jgi:putative ABC transport system substrate-binding protein